MKSHENKHILPIDMDFELPLVIDVDDSERGV